jgi:hypothetical protein
MANDGAPVKSNSPSKLLFIAGLSDRCERWRTSLRRRKLDSNWLGPRLLRTNC